MKIVFENAQELRYFLASSFSELTGDQSHRQDRFVAASRLVTAIGDDLSLDAAALDFEDLRYLNDSLDLVRHEPKSRRLNANGRPFAPGPRSARARSRMTRCFAGGS